VWVFQTKPTQESGEGQAHLAISYKEKSAGNINYEIECTQAIGIVFDSLINILGTL